MVRPPLVGWKVDYSHLAPDWGWSGQQMSFSSSASWGRGGHPVWNYIPWLVTDSVLTLVLCPLIQGYDTKFCFYIYFRPNPQFQLYHSKVFWETTKVLDSDSEVINKLSSLTTPFSTNAKPESASHPPAPVLLVCSSCGVAELEEVPFPRWSNLIWSKVYVPGLKFFPLPSIWGTVLISTPAIATTTKLVR